MIGFCFELDILRIKDSDVWKRNAEQSTLRDLKTVQQSLALNECLLSCLTARGDMLFMGKRGYKVRAYRQRTASD